MLHVRPEEILPGIARCVGGAPPVFHQGLGICHLVRLCNGVLSVFSTFRA